MQENSVAIVEWERSVVQMAAVLQAQMSSTKHVGTYAVKHMVADCMNIFSH
jgi:hypothetical protein